MSPRVARVEVTTVNGTVRDVEITRGVFAYSSKNVGDFARSVTAYDAAGAVVASKSIPAAAPPSTG